MHEVRAYLEVGHRDLRRTFLYNGTKRRQTLNLFSHMHTKRDSAQFPEFSKPQGYPYPPVVSRHNQRGPSCNSKGDVTVFLEGAFLVWRGTVRRQYSASSRCMNCCIE